MTDPYEPGWRPEYTGDDSLGDVGSGAEFGVSLYDLYRAGRVLYPELAATYSGLTMRVHQLTGPAHAVFEVDGQGIQRAHRMMLDLREELQDVLRRTSANLEEVAQGLVDTAADYAATDEAATDEFAKRIEKDPGDLDDGRDYSAEYRRPPVHIPDPVEPAPPPAGSEYGEGRKVASDEPVAQ